MFDTLLLLSIINKEETDVANLTDWLVCRVVHFLLNFSFLWMVLMVITDDDYFTNDLLFWWIPTTGPLDIELSLDSSQLNPIKAFINWFAKF